MIGLGSDKNRWETSCYFCTFFSSFLNPQRTTLTYSAMNYNVPKILPNFSSCLEPAHPSVKIWSPFALVSVSVLPKSFGLSCFLDIFPGKVVQPGPPIIYPWDVSRSCAWRLCPQTNYSNTAKHATIQNISWLKKNSRSKRRTPEYPVVWQQVFFSFLVLK